MRGWNDDEVGGVGGIGEIGNRKSDQSKLAAWKNLIGGSDGGASGGKSADSLATEK